MVTILISIILCIVSWQNVGAWALLWIVPGAALVDLAMAAVMLPTMAAADAARNRWTIFKGGAWKSRGVGFAALAVAGLALILILSSRRSTPAYLPGLLAAPSKSTAQTTFTDQSVHEMLQALRSSPPPTAQKPDQQQANRDREDQYIRKLQASLRLGMTKAEVEKVVDLFPDHIYTYLGSGTRPSQREPPGWQIEWNLRPNIYGAELEPWVKTSAFGQPEPDPKPRLVCIFEDTSFSAANGLPNIILDEQRTRLRRWEVER